MLLVLTVLNTPGLVFSFAFSDDRLARPIRLVETTAVLCIYLAVAAPVHSGE